MKLAALGKRNTLWVGFVAVLVPLAVLLAFQYRWLRELDSFSERAQKAQVESLLEAVSKNVEYFYTDAGQVLDLQPAIFAQNQLDHAAYQFKKKGVVGVKRLFVTAVEGSTWKIWRAPGEDWNGPDGPGFNQRFIGEISTDGATIDGRWERGLGDAGDDWEIDFPITYVRT
jgi:hypothetical protein